MLTQIGILLIGIACLLGAIFIAYALNNLAGVLGGIEKTVEKLPEQLDDIFKQTGNLIEESNHTLQDVNDKLKQLSPLFYIVGDVGNATRKFTSSLVDVTDSVKKKTEEGKDIADKNDLGGVYGAVALGYYWLKQRGKKK
ncbi:DUF948 domain-containing protein [Ornithinibacillus gellani]|uniref:DUF948 domain-containing protein n=1 Tax=Ornithinibacillus gellani TaxID=2293253 RepID=UPI000F462F35|nr:DUF948 domain-containing protein [Ornithinibacillus gellani]TQS76167.1 DUF948 domain-containing protein [Ornithinibacillus gellani]